MLLTSPSIRLQRTCRARCLHTLHVDSPTTRTQLHASIALHVDTPTTRRLQRSMPPYAPRRYTCNAQPELHAPYLPVATHRAPPVQTFTSMHLQRAHRASCLHCPPCRYTYNAH